MLQSVLAIKESGLRGQRNILLGVSIFLLISNICLSIGLSAKQERILVIPATFSKSFWVEGDYINDTGLEEMSEWMISLLLNFTPHCIDAKREKALRYIAPQSYEDFKFRLFERDKRYKKEDYSKSFVAQKYKTNAASKVVIVEGVEREYTGGKQISQEKKRYILRFKGSGGRQYLQELEVYGG